MTTEPVVGASAASSVLYDGFISYSHSADDLLAPRLQAGLQRFAKPWWKRRAVRIFRDESSLAANPHLWSSITEAMDSSGWFVLLLSEDAAGSEWVGKEIEHWKANQPADRILPVVTDGEFGWSDGDVVGSSVPPALHGVFSEEPRWVDLRFARGEDTLDLKNPAFAAAVADIASSIRGVPKDELASEEVRQHRRTVRTAWAAGIAVSVLAVAATVAGVFAIEQRNSAESSQAFAEQEAARANQEAVRANSEADRANQETDRANDNAAEATGNAQLAEARELAASSVSILDLDPELATLLAVSAVDASPEGADLPLQVENALWRAGSTNRLIDSFDFDYAGHVSLAPDGTKLAATTAVSELSVFDTSTGGVLWTYDEETVDHFTQPAWGPDGRIALAVIDSTSEIARSGSAEEDGLPNRLVVLDGATGSRLHTITFEGCKGAEVPAWSPNGAHLAVSNGSEGCPRAVDGQETSDWIEVFDTITWESIVLLPMEAGGGGGVPRYDMSGALHALAPGRVVEVFDAITYERRPTTAASGIGDVSPDGSRYFLSASESGEGGTAFSAWVFDAETGQSLDVFYTGFSHPSFPLGIEVTPDGRFVVVGTEGAFAHVYETATGYELFRLATGELYSSTFDPATERLYTSGTDGGVRVWDLRESAVGVESTGDLGRYSWVNGTGFWLGLELGAMETVDFATDEWAVQFFDLSSGKLFGAQLARTVDPRAVGDGVFRVIEVSSGLESLYDPRTAERRDLRLCQEDGFDEDGQAVCVGEGDPDWFQSVASAGGGELLAFGVDRTEGRPVFTGHYRRIDPDTGAVLESIEPGEQFDALPSTVDPADVALLTADWVFANGDEKYGIYDRTSGELLLAETLRLATAEPSPAGNMLMMRAGTKVVVIDTASWEVVVEVSFPSRVRGAAFNEDGSRLAVGTLDSLLVIDTATGTTARQLRLPGVSDAYWMDDETLLVGTTRGLFGVVSLSTDAFLSDVRSSLRRTFSATECDLYNIDPCPTLDEIRGP